MVDGGGGAGGKAMADDGGGMGGPPDGNAGTRVGAAMGVSRATGFAATGLAGNGFSMPAVAATGFSTGGATAADIALMRSIVGPEMGVKASGGIRSLDDLQKMAAAGATRIGASASVKIMEAAAGKPVGGAPATGY